MTSEEIVKTKTFNPFPGLRPFHMEESHLFFGREGQTDEVLMKLSEYDINGTNNRDKLVINSLEVKALGAVWYNW